MRKIVIIGAGHVGSHCGYALAHAGVCEEIVLVDLDWDKAVAQALDIADSVGESQRETKVRSGDYKDCEDAAIVVIAIGEARKAGQTRL
ncbi:MAG: L-lactate dehydrogenase, partial [Eubacterium sp.]|nr:L-lactate dehydrogenase [Eubacterium sp.]